MAISWRERNLMTVAAVAPRYILAPGWLKIDPQLPPAAQEPEVPEARCRRLAFLAIDSVDGHGHHGIRTRRKPALFLRNSGMGATMGPMFPR